MRGGCRTPHRPAANAARRSGFDDDLCNVRWLDPGERASSLAATGELSGRPESLLFAEVGGRSQRLPESRKVLDLIGELGPVSFQSVHSRLV